jgi:drug/metabolite transporter (DMT)-like permease
VLGAILSILSAAAFALNTATARRAVVTGTPRQGTAVTVPIGVALFLPAAIVTGEIGRLHSFPPSAFGWMAGVGLLHFLVGRYCNYRANQAAGANITAPVIQLQIVVTLVLAVAVLGEPCSLLQGIGGCVMVTGALATQFQRPGARRARARMPDAPVFVARHLSGYLFASLAAIAYGTTPIMTRFALERAGPTAGILGGLIAYGAATAVVALALLWPPLWREVKATERENVRWFAYSGVFVAFAQGFFYSAVAVAPIMLVSPLLQFSLVFRLLFAKWLNPYHEVFGALVVVGVAASIVGAIAVSLDTDVILHALGAPEGLARVLRWRI